MKASNQTTGGVRNSKQNNKPANHSHHSSNMSGNQVTINTGL